MLSAMVPIELSVVVYALPFVIGIAWAATVLVVLLRIERHLRNRHPRD